MSVPFIIVSLCGLNGYGNPVQRGYDSIETAAFMMVAFDSVTDRYEAQDFSSATKFEPCEDGVFESWDATDELRRALKVRVALLAMSRLETLAMRSAEGAA